MSQQGRSDRWTSVVAAGAAVGLVQVVFAIGFASIVFGGRIAQYLAEGIALFLAAAVATLVIFAWRAGKRGVVGGLQATGAALLSVVAATTGLRGSPAGGFLAVVAATAVVTLLCAAVFLVLGARRRADLLRYVPLPVVGGFLAGVGWLLLQGGIHMAIRQPLFFTRFEQLLDDRALRLWLPTVAFGTVMLFAVRITKTQLAIPLTIAAGIVGFALVTVATGSSIADARAGGWLLGSFTDDMGWNSWSLTALTGADPLAVARSWASILVAVAVSTLVLLFNLGRTEEVLDRHLDGDRELRDAGIANAASGALGGIPAYHDPSLSSIAARMRADAQRVGLVAAVVALIALVAGETVVELIPRMIVGGVLAFLGLSFIVEWVWDRRRTLPRVEYVVVLVIFAVVLIQGFAAGFVVGLVLAVGLFAVSYGRVDLVHEVAFGEVYRSSVDRPTAERERLRARAHEVQILRVSGHVFFGSANRLLERIRARVESETPPRYLVIDLQHVTGVDASAVAALSKAERLASAGGTEIVLTGASEPVRRRLERGGALGTEGVVTLEPELDAALQRCEEALLEGSATEGSLVAGEAVEGEAVPDAAAASTDGPPAGLLPYLDRLLIEEGTVVLEQDEPSGDIYVLAEGRLAVETSTAEGKRVRLRTLRPGVVVGEIALYTGVPRTADVVAETRCVVLRCSGEQIARIEGEDPELAAAVHRWLAGTLADRLSDTMRTFDALMD